jgi:hypothetical protein
VAAPDTRPRHDRGGRDRGGAGGVALLQPAGWVLAVLCLLAALAVGAVAAVSRSLTLAVLAACWRSQPRSGHPDWRWGRARTPPAAATTSARGRPAAAPGEGAVSATRPGQVRDPPAPYGTRGTVLRATGYAPDGSYGPGSTITLLVGSRAPEPASSSGG